MSTGSTMVYPSISRAVPNPNTRCLFVGPNLIQGNSGKRRDMSNYYLLAGPACGRKESTFVPGQVRAGWTTYRGTELQETCWPSKVSPLPFSHQLFRHRTQWQSGEGSSAVSLAIGTCQDLERGTGGQGLGEILEKGTGSGEGYDLGRRPRVMRGTRSWERGPWAWGGAVNRVRQWGTCVSRENCLQV